MHRIAVFCAVAFITFFAWIIYMADAGQPLWILTWVRAMPYGDKLGHFMMFGVMAALVNLALRLKTLTLGKVHFLLGSFLVFLFAVLEELSQFYFPRRTVDLFDLLAGSLGILILGGYGSRYFFSLLARKK